MTELAYVGINNTGQGHHDQCMFLWHMMGGLTTIYVAVHICTATYAHTACTIPSLNGNNETIFHCVIILKSCWDSGIGKHMS